MAVWSPHNTLLVGVKSYKMWTKHPKCNFGSLQSGIQHSGHWWPLDLDQTAQKCRFLNTIPNIKLERTPLSCECGKLSMVNEPNLKQRLVPKNADFKILFYNSKYQAWTATFVPWTRNCEADAQNRQRRSIPPLPQIYVVILATPTRLQIQRYSGTAGLQTILRVGSRFCQSWIKTLITFDS